VEAISCDNLNCFGKWKPGSNTATNQFLAALNGIEDVVAELRTPDSRSQALISGVHGDELEFKFLT
jgi:hypothetical protein